MAAVAVHGPELPAAVAVFAQAVERERNRWHPLAALVLRLRAGVLPGFAVRNTAGVADSVGVALAECDVPSGGLACFAHDVPSFRPASSASAICRFLHAVGLEFTHRWQSRFAASMAATDRPQAAQHQHQSGSLMAGSGRHGPLFHVMAAPPGSSATTPTSHPPAAGTGPPCPPSAPPPTPPPPHPPPPHPSPPTP